MDTVESLRRHSRRARCAQFIGLGGNFVHAVPEREAMERPGRGCG